MTLKKTQISKHFCRMVHFCFKNTICVHVTRKENGEFFVFNEL